MLDTLFNEVRVRRAILVLTIFAAVSAPLAILNAQTASEVIEPSFAPEPQRLVGSIVFSGGDGLEPPAGAERFTLALGGVEIGGALPQLAPAGAALEDRLLGGDIRVSEIFEAAAAYETAYADAGFALVRIVVPPQSLQNGDVLRLQVVDGYVERIDASSAPEPVRERIEALTAGLVNERALQLERLERKLLLAGDTYGVALGSALSTGTQQGGTVVVLDADHRRVTGFVGADNRLSQEAEDVSLDFGLEVNSPLGIGDAAYIRFSAAPKDVATDMPRLRTISAGAILPVGTDGMHVNVEGSLSESTTTSGGLTAPSRFERLSFRLYYPHIRTRKTNLSSQLSFDVQRDTQDIISGGIRTQQYEEDLRILRGAVEYNRQLSGERFLEAGAALSFGLDSLGAGSSGISRTGANTAFEKLEASARLSGRIDKNWTFALAGRAQTSFGAPLVVSEQFGPARASELSAFDAGALSGDSGVVLRADVSRPFAQEIAGVPATIRPYAYGGIGFLRLEQPQAPEVRDLQASAIGFGVEILGLQQDRFRSASVRFEYAKGFTDDTPEETDRVSVAASYRF